MSDEYQPRSADRILEILRSGDVNPRSWQREAADMLERLARRAAQAEGELDVLSISHRDLGKRLADAARVDSRKTPPTRAEIEDLVMEIRENRDSYGELEWRIDHEEAIQRVLSLLKGEAPMTDKEQQAETIPITFSRDEGLTWMNSRDNPHEFAEYMAELKAKRDADAAIEKQ